jgi:hypothetical protein
MKHKVGDMVLGYLDFPGHKREVLGVIKSIEDGLYNIEWMNSSSGIADEIGVTMYKKNLRRHLAKASSR